MGYFKWLAAGLIGAAIGGAIWVAVGYYGNAEVGYIAWAVGLLAGLGVRFAAGDEDGIGPGVAALIAAVFVIVASKYLVVSLLVDRQMQELQAANIAQMTPEEQYAELAHEVVKERLKLNQPIAWPAGKSEEEAAEQADFPPDIWKEAQLRWEKMDDAEKQRRADQKKVQAELFIQGMRAIIKGQAFQSSFGLFDLLWFGLAAFTAFKVGSGASSDD